jgi:solute carrier family 25 (mitochondrial S-adenosylmethionine transporter), member 26
MNELLHPLLAGAIAGTSVDSLLFPLDTIKTRLQSKQGFKAAGGFKHIYKGLNSAVLGSAPSAALFFVAYESAQKALRQTEMGDTGVHMLAASIGEVSACLVRVPTEVIKQRLQVGMVSGFTKAVSDIYSSVGVTGFYRGFRMTCFREIPFACIQFPLYESFKRALSKLKSQRLNSLEAGACGFVAGGIAAALTTPLDVIKTRIMLTKVNSTNSEPRRVEYSGDGEDDIYREGN